MKKYVVTFPDGHRIQSDDREESIQMAIDYQEKLNSVEKSEPAVE